VYFDKYYSASNDILINHFKFQYPSFVVEKVITLSR
jgi:hypothetical protein